MPILRAWGSRRGLPSERGDDPGDGRVWSLNKLINSATRSSASHRAWSDTERNMHCNREQNDAALVFEVLDILPSRSGAELAISLSRRRLTPMLRPSKKADQSSKTRDRCTSLNRNPLRNCQHLCPVPLVVRDPELLDPLLIRGPWNALRFTPLIRHQIEQIADDFLCEITNPHQLRRRQKA